MPTITYDKADMLGLIGKITEKELIKALENMKPDIGENTEKEITIELTPERPDMFGIEGLARAIRSYVGISPGLQRFPVEDSGIEIKVDRVPTRPYVASAIIKRMSLTDELIKSLMGIQEVLHGTIGKKRANAAIGIHDYDNIVPPIRYTQASKAAKMMPLGLDEELSLQDVLKKTPKGVDYGHLINGSPQYPVFADSKGIFSLPPIINSNRTKVTEKTQNLFIDLTGVNEESVRQALTVVVTNLVERGCRIESVRLKHENRVEVMPTLAESTVKVEREFVRQGIGLDLDLDAIESALRKMGYGTSKAGSTIIVTVPAYRSDILHKVDILEDVAIGYGYNNLTPALPSISTNGELEPVEKKSDSIRELVIGMGFQEIMRPVLSNLDEQFRKMNQEKQELVEIANPVSAEYTCMRCWLLPSSIEFMKSNRQLEHPQRIFEIGDVVVVDEKEETCTKTLRKLALTISDSKTGFFEIKGVFESLVKSLDIKYKLKPSDNPSFIKGRVADIIVAGGKIGMLGEVHPLVLENWGLEMPVVALEIEIENL